MIENMPNASSKAISFLRSQQKRLIVLGSIIVVYALAGFFLAPWLIKNKAIATVDQMFGADLRIANIDLNPFALSIRIQGVELDDPENETTATIGEIFVNFQLSSLFRWAWTFDEARISDAEVFASRNASGKTNLAYLTQKSSSEAPPKPVEDESPGMPRLLIANFIIDNFAFNWRDEVPVDTVDTRIGPVDVAIQNLNTLPQRAGQQSVQITTDTQGTLSWSGELQLNPFRSAAHASIKGSHFPLISAYLKKKAGFDVIDGNADVSLDYVIDTAPDGGIRAVVENFDLAFSDVVVNTWTESHDTDREVLRLPLAALTGGTFHWPEQTVTIASISLDDAVVNLHRDNAGHLNVVPERTALEEPAPDVVEDDDAVESEPWKVSLEQFSINRLSVDLLDESVTPPGDVGISRLDLTISDISNEPNAIFPTDLSLQLRTGGSIKMEGGFAVIPAFTLDLAANVNDVALLGAHPYLKPRADVHLDSGALQLSGDIRISPTDPFQFDGDIAITDFNISETDEHTRLGSWKELRADNVAVSVGSNKVEISEVLLDQGYGDILIAADGSVNLGRIKKGDSTEDDDSETAKPEVSDEAKSQGVITIGRVIVTDAAADFTDESLPLPFTAKIEALNGELSTISTSSRDASNVSFEGKVDEYGFVRITGFVTPLKVSDNTDLQVVFQNVNMPKFTAYSVPFAGREIANGSLDLDLGYKVEKSELIGENKLVLRDFELGEKVDHPGALSLPLGLAVALLKGPDGNIDIDLPVRGNVDDPEFSYGRVVASALGNLVVKIVASPFLLLGKLVGVEANELEYIQFLDGRPDLTPPEIQRTVKLAEALQLRPELGLELSGVVDREADGAAIRQRKLEEIITARIESSDEADADAMYAQQRQSALEELFTESSSAENVKAELNTVRLKFTTESTGEDGKPVSDFDELAFSNELQRRLTELQPLEETELVELAKARAESVRAAVTANDETLDSRIRIVDLQGVTRDDDEMIQMKITLSSRGTNGITDEE